LKKTKQKKQNKTTQKKKRPGNRRFLFIQLSQMGNKTELSGMNVEPSHWLAMRNFYIPKIVGHPF